MYPFIKHSTKKYYRYVYQNVFYSCALNKYLNIKLYFGQNQINPVFIELIRQSVSFTYLNFLHSREQECIVCKVYQICRMQVIEQKYNSQVSHRMNSYLHLLRYNYISAFITNLCAEGDSQILHCIPNAYQFSEFSIYDA